MSRFKRMRPLPLVVGGIITVALAIWLLPKPQTDVDTVPQAVPVTTVSAPGVDVEPTVPSPALVPTPDERAEAPSGQTTVATVPQPSTTHAGPYPMSSRGFQTAMRYRRDGITACYDQWAADQPDIPARQVVRFHLQGGDDQSLVDRIEVMDATGDAGRMEDCVLGVMADAEFEASEVDRAYTLPFNFGEASDK